MKIKAFGSFLIDGGNLPSDVTSYSINSCGCLENFGNESQFLRNCSSTLHETSCLIPVTSVRKLHNLEVHFASSGCECTTLETLMSDEGVISNGCLVYSRGWGGAAFKSTVLLVSGPLHVRYLNTVAQSV